MGDDEPEHEPDRIQPPISKRKASIDSDSSASARKPHKLPRLHVNGASSAGARLSSSPSSHTVPSRTQPGPSSLSSAGLKKSGVSLTQGASRTRQQPQVQSADSSTSPSDFPNTLSQRVRQVIARDKEREKAKTREREEQDGASSSRRGPSSTARKRTTDPKNVREVCTANLLKDAQKSSTSFIFFCRRQH